MSEQILIRGARLHNLKDIDLAIPKHRLVVLSGPSGSGKSSLALDILHRESQRQYLEALGLLPFGFGRAAVEQIVGLTPTVSLDQRLTNRSPRSTVGTITEIYTYLRVLFARLGERPCPHCGSILPALSGQTGELSEFRISPDESADDPEEFFTCPHCGKDVLVLEMGHFSFNTPAGACPTCTGLGVLKQVDLQRLVDEQKSLLGGAVAGWEPQYSAYYARVLQAAGRHYGFQIDPTAAVREFTPAQRDLLLFGVDDPVFQAHFPEIDPPKTVRQGRFEGVRDNFARRYAKRVAGSQNSAKLEEFMVTMTCPDCLGTRLRPESRGVTVRGKSISDLSRLALTDLGIWLEALPESLSTLEMLAAEAVLTEIQIRMQRLADVGAGYLSLERSAPSLSQGEAQRLRLASLLGSRLSGLLYIFDEPTIGLHPRDTRKLIGVLRSLRDQGSTVLVIEHDLDVIQAGDHLIDFGPGGGRQGGRIVASGTPEQVAGTAGSPTGDYLSDRLSIPFSPVRRTPGEKTITIHGARHHNLKGITVQIPLGLFVVVTGVSGSGKSSLIFDVLERGLRQRLYRSGGPSGEHLGIEGSEHLDRVISSDQRSIGRMPHSNVATFADIFTPIRDVFANTQAARSLGFTKRHFSFNVPGGRCERCEGAGVLNVSMHFMPDVEVRCPVCQGKRFTAETLQVQFNGCSIADVLEMTVEEALAIFQAIPSARSPLQVLLDVGLGYLQLGQPTASLSGGEAQRVKLAKELGKGAAQRSLYLLDEPTTGLHLADTARLVQLLQNLVDGGGSVVVIEHNLELVKTADWVIDLGPEGGEAGGQVVAEGSPEQVAETPGSITGQFLKAVLARKKD